MNKTLLKEKLLNSLAIIPASAILLTFTALLYRVSIPSVEMYPAPIIVSLGSLIFHGNFHPVTPGLFYRSAQLEPEELQRRIQQFGIKTVIDLRLDGKREGDTIAAEKAIVEAEGATYLHLPLRTTRLPSKELALHIVNTITDAKLPTLVHCSDGIHRTGVVSAIWLLAVRGDSLGEALDQLSLQFGYVKTLREWFAKRQPHPVLDEIIWSYATDRRANYRLQFRDWINAALPSVHDIEDNNKEDLSVYAEANPVKDSAPPKPE